MIFRNAVFKLILSQSPCQIYIILSNLSFPPSSPQTIIASVGNDGLFLLFPLLFVYLSHLIALMNAIFPFRYCIHVVNKDSLHFCQSQEENIWSFTIKYDICCKSFIDILHQVEEFTLFPWLVEFLSIDVKIVKCFFCICCDYPRAFFPLVF